MVVIEPIRDKEHEKEWQGSIYLPESITKRQFSDLKKSLTRRTDSMQTILLRIQDETNKENASFIADVTSTFRSEISELKKQMRALDQAQTGSQIDEMRQEMAAQINEIKSQNNSQILELKN